MVFWQTHIFLVLLLTFSGLNLIRSDCGTDVDRLNGGFCESNLRRIDHNDKDLTRRFRDFEQRGMHFLNFNHSWFFSIRISSLKNPFTFHTDERIDSRQRVAREERDELRRDFDARRQDESRRLERDGDFERRNDLNRRGLYGFFFIFRKFTAVF